MYFSMSVKRYWIIDDPYLKALAIYFHINKKRKDDYEEDEDNIPEIFDERIYPLSKDKSKKVTINIILTRLRMQLDQYVRYMLYSDKLSGPIITKLAQKLAFESTKRSPNSDFKYPEPIIENFKFQFIRIKHTANILVELRP